MCAKLRVLRYSQLLEFHSANLLPEYSRKVYWLYVLTRFRNTHKESSNTTHNVHIHGSQVYWYLPNVCYLAPSFLVGDVILLSLHVCTAETKMNFPVTLTYFGLLWHQRGYHLISQEVPREIVALRAFLILLYVNAEDVRRDRNLGERLNNICDSWLRTVLAVLLDKIDTNNTSVLQNMKRRKVMVKFTL